MLLRVRLKDLFLHLSCIVVFMVTFPVVIIDSHCQSIHVLEQGGFSLLPSRNKILDLIGKPLVITMAEHTIFPI